MTVGHVGEDVVGKNVGDAVGEDAFVGEAVVGDNVGKYVGFSVGEDMGSLVGKDVGSLVGDNVITVRVYLCHEFRIEIDGQNTSSKS